MKNDCYTNLKISITTFQSLRFIIKKNYTLKWEIDAHTFTKNNNIIYSTSTAVSR